MQGTDTTLNPYLAFNGKCREAMTFYKDALDGQCGTKRRLIRLETWVNIGNFTDHQYHEP
jgi:hypothetical protein